MMQAREFSGFPGVEDISVLLIDASPSEAACITQTILQGEPMYNFYVTREKNLIQALDFLRTSTVDVLLLDMELTDSAEFGDIAFVHKLFPELPMVVISSASGMDVQYKVLQNGAQAFLIKEQCDSVTLRNAICQVLAHEKTPEAYKVV